MTPPPGPIFEAAALGHGEDATPSDESMEGCRRDIPEDTVVVGCAPPPPPMPAWEKPGSKISSQSMYVCCVFLSPGGVIR